jgi:hypothetical protein
MMVSGLRLRGRAILILFLTPDSVLVERRELPAL